MEPLPRGRNTTLHVFLARSRGTRDKLTFLRSFQVTGMRSGVDIRGGDRGGRLGSPLFQRCCRPLCEFRA